MPFWTFRRNWSWSIWSGRTGIPGSLDARDSMASTRACPSLSNHHFACCFFLSASSISGYLQCQIPPPQHVWPSRAPPRYRHPSSAGRPMSAIFSTESRTGRQRDSSRKPLAIAQVGAWSFCKFPVEARRRFLLRGRRRWLFSVILRADLQIRPGIINVVRARDRLFNRPFAVVFSPPLVALAGATG